MTHRLITHDHPRPYQAGSPAVLHQSLGIRYTEPLLTWTSHPCPPCPCTHDMIMCIGVLRVVQWIAEQRETRPLILLFLLCPSHQYLLVDMAEDFCQSSVFSILNQLMVYLFLNMPSQDPTVHVHMFLAQLKGREASYLESKEKIQVFETLCVRSIP